MVAVSLEIFKANCGATVSFDTNVNIICSLIEIKTKLGHTTLKL